MKWDYVSVVPISGSAVPSHAPSAAVIRVGGNAPHHRRREAYTVGAESSGPAAPAVVALPVRRRWFPPRYTHTILPVRYAMHMRCVPHRGGCLYTHSPPCMICHVTHTRCAPHREGHVVTGWARRTHGTKPATGGMEKPVRERRVRGSPHRTALPVSYVMHMPCASYR